MYLSRREKEMLTGVIGLVALIGTSAGFAVYECAQYNQELMSVMSSETHFDVVDVKDAELCQDGDSFKAIIKCTHKQTKQPIVIEYQLTAIDFIIMNQPEYDTWHYMSTHIIPTQDPSFVGTEKEYTQHISRTPDIQPEAQQS